MIYKMIMTFVSINLCTLPYLFKIIVTLQSGLASLMDAENKCHERSRLIQQSQQALLTMVTGQDNMAANNEQVCDGLFIHVQRGGGGDFRSFNLLDECREKFH